MIPFDCLPALQQDLVDLLNLDHLEDLSSLLHLQGQWDPGDLVDPSESKMFF